MTFEKLASDARRAVKLAQEEARLLNHSYIGTEHILLGIVAEGEGIGARVLGSCHVSLEGLRRAAAETLGTGAAPVSGRVPFDTAAKTTLLRAASGSKTGVDDVGTGPLLLALIGETPSPGVDLLVSAAADTSLDGLRQRVLDAMLRQRVLDAMSEFAAEQRDWYAEGLGESVDEFFSDRASWLGLDRSQLVGLVEGELERVWDEGNATGLDGWIGPGRGAGEVDDHAVAIRRRDTHAALERILGRLYPADGSPQ